MSEISFTNNARLMRAVSGQGYAHSPRERMKKPTHIGEPPNYPRAELKPPMLRPVPRGSRDRKQVYNPARPNLPNTPKFSGDFESGNLGNVFQTGPTSFEIHIMPEAKADKGAPWFFFKVENIEPGNYKFHIIGTFSSPVLFRMGVHPVALSMNDMKQGIGWKRFGDELSMLPGKTPKMFTIFFKFTVKAVDTMYFAFNYPYTYTDVLTWLGTKAPMLVVAPIGVSHGGIEVPAVFWDADIQKWVDFRESIKVDVRGQIKKPVLVVTARHHPAESNGSWAMEGFLEAITSDSEVAMNVRENYSILIIPMMNVDAVICGYHRSTLAGYDMNRPWMNPVPGKNPVEASVLDVLRKMSVCRKILFFLDYHGHNGQENAFTYGVENDGVWLSDMQILFPRLMSRSCDVFDFDGGCTLVPTAWTKTMRVALRHHFHIPFSYTLEMSTGALDIGPNEGTQMTPDDYKSVGRSTVTALSAMLVDTLITKLGLGTIPPDQE